MPPKAGAKKGPGKDKDGTTVKTVGSICVESCQAEEECESINCVLCHRKFHSDCVDIADTNRTWSCTQCRQLPSKVDQLLDTVNKLVSLTESLLTKRDEDSKKLTNIDLEQVLATENITVITQSVDDIKTQVSKLPINVDLPKKKKCSILGDSLLRDMKSKSKEYVLSHMNGIQIADVKIKLAGDSEKYDEMYIVIGTNDCATQTAEDKIIDDYKEMLSVASEKADKVFISSIPPRGDDNEDHSSVDDKIKSVNAKVKQLADEAGVTFVDNDCNFRYANGELDDSLLLLDRLHLSQKGVTRLIKNLGLTDHIACTLTNAGGGAKWPNPGRGSGRGNKPQPGRDDNVPSPVMFRSHKDELSNFYPCTLHIYGDKFKSSEAAYQFAYAAEHDEWEIAEQIKNARTAAEAKRLSKQIPLEQISDQWNDKKVDIMREVLEEKFNQCHQFRQKLQQTGSKTLIENTDNPFWARGPDGNGRNKLGELLMDLRNRMFKDNRWSRFVQQRSSHFSAIDDECEYCGEWNHTMDRCRHGKFITCLECGGLGHKKKKCNHNEYTY